MQSLLLYLHAMHIKQQTQRAYTTNYSNIDAAWDIVRKYFRIGRPFLKYIQNFQVIRSEIRIIFQLFSTALSENILGSRCNWKCHVRFARDGTEFPM